MWFEKNASAGSSVSSLGGNAHLIGVQERGFPQHTLDASHASEGLNHQWAHPCQIRTLSTEDCALDQAPDTLFAHHVDRGVAEGHRAILRLDGLHSFLDAMQTNEKELGGRAQAEPGQAYSYLFLWD